jgi:hypothetical protein
MKKEISYNLTPTKYACLIASHVSTFYCINGLLVWLCKDDLDHGADPAAYDIVDQLVEPAASKLRKKLKNKEKEYQATWKVVTNSPFPLDGNFEPVQEERICRSRGGIGDSSRTRTLNVKYERLPNVFINIDDY